MVKKRIAISILMPLCLMASVRPAQAADGQNAAASTASTRAQQQSAEPAENNPKRKGGLKIHGHWVVEVKRPDGTLADRREFENSYIGGAYMGYLLGGTVVNVDTAILFSSATNGAGSFCNGAR
jgi:hypothetical protein